MSWKLQFDLTGRVIQNRKVLHRVLEGHKKGKETAWRCVCLRCGKEATVLSSHLREGRGCQPCVALQRANDNLIKPGTALRDVYRDGYKSVARQRKIPFALSIEEFAFLAAQPCFYCGALPVAVHKSRRDSFTYNGIDRVDNSKGYTLDNCEPCCRPCNVGKNSGTVEDYIERCKRVALLHA